MPRSFRFVLFLVFLAGLVPGSRAQSAPQAQQAAQSPFAAPQTSVLPAAPGLDAQSIAVLNACKAALGAAVSARITDSVIQATVTDPANPTATPGTVTIKTKGTDMVRWEGSSNGKTFATISVHGQQRHQSGNGWVTDASANAIHQRLTHLPALMIGHELVRGELSAVYVAAETLNGREVHRIKLARVAPQGGPMGAQLTKNSEIEVFIDAQTNLIAKIAYIHLSTTDWRMGVPTEIFYDDYRPINGMMIPFRQRTVINKSLTTDLQITSVQFNAGLPDSDFKGGN